MSVSCREIDINVPPARTGARWQIVRLHSVIAHFFIAVSGARAVAFLLLNCGASART
jgi:hypothetical protein